MSGRNKKREAFAEISELGKLPPQDIELEEAVLGVLLITQDSFEKVADLLKPETFYKESNAIIFSAIQSIAENKSSSGSTKVDILTVTSELKKMGKLDVVGGAYHVTQLTNKVASSANIENHARILVEKYLFREIIRISQEYQDIAFTDEDDIFDTLDEWAKEVDTVRNYTADSESEMPFKLSLQERIKEKEQMVKEGVTFTGISTGNYKLDGVLGGWIKTNLIVLAARPAQGKSVKALNYAKIAAKNGFRSLVFSLEMSVKELIDRLIVEESMIMLHEYRSNKITRYDMQKIINAGKELSKLPISIYDKAAINGNYIRKKVKAEIKRYGSVGLIVIDYMQLMKSIEKTNNREVEISSISRDLKAIAKEFDVPVIALSQLSRSVLTSNDKRPNMSHLRESGAIEQDADIVMFIYRPSTYFEYGQHPDEMYSMNSITKIDYERASELIIEKNRNGIPNARIQEKFFGYYSTFSEVDLERSNALDPFEAGNNSDIVPKESDDFISEIPF